MNKKGLVISGGTIEDAFAMQMIEEFMPDYIIGVDSGLNFLYRNQVTPTHIVGDFDSVDSKVISYYRGCTNVPIREFNPVKDATDTEIGVRLAIELGAEEIILLGATGTRLDHVMSNIQILKIALDNSVKAYLLDSCNRISLWKDEITLLKSKQYGKYFSLFPFGGTVKNLSIKGAKYPLEGYCMTPYESRTVSNELQDEEVFITFPGGMVILMETRDERK